MSSDNTLRPDLKKYLEYVINTEGHATVESFDEDFEPIGPAVREELRGYMEVYMGRLSLTEKGYAAIYGDKR